MKSTRHLRYELLRTLRNPRTLAITAALPLLIFFAVGSANRHARSAGISFPLYFMTGMAAYGAMFATVAPGARIAADRATGWTRQLRTTPLPLGAYFGAKVLVAYLVALPTLLLLYLAGTALGVHLAPGQWLEMTGLLLVGLAPFVVMGIVAGHLIRVETLPVAVGGLVVVFALFGGAFGSLFNHGAMLTLVKLLPSFWLVRSGKAALTAGGWPPEAWVVVAIWTVVLLPLAVLAYRRDTARL